MPEGERRFSVSRRQLIIAGVGVVGVVGMTQRPRDKSGPREKYFLDMQDALAREGIGTPTLVIDLERLDANIDTLLTHLPNGMGYRIVAKSLPSLDLLSHIRNRTGTDRLMTFNQPMLNALSAHMPDADQLLGKPLPIAAARTYFSELLPKNGAAADQVQWLIDTPVRLEQYRELAIGLDRTFRINLEIDVGLHRGGFTPGEELRRTLEVLKADPSLSFSGFMGYEPHLPSLPTTLGWRDRAKRAAWETYSNCLSLAAEVFSGDEFAAITRNAAGSPTYRYYQDTSLANEVSAGSCLVKPTHFDTDLLEPHLPASFIATPVVKSLDRTVLPGLEFAEGIQRSWNPNSTKTVFIYGGHWLADPVDPPGLEYNSTFGRSSNQEMLNGGSDLEISPDEFVFLRPHQSEAVFLQFGDIAVYSNGKIVERWPVFEASA